MDKKIKLSEEQLRNIAEATKILQNNISKVIEPIEISFYKYYENLKINLPNDLKNKIEYLPGLTITFQNKFQNLIDFQFLDVIKNLVDPYVDVFLTLRENIKKIQEKLKNISEETGWWITPSLLEYYKDFDLKTIFQKINEYNNVNNDTITDMYIKVYLSNNFKYLKNVVKNWGNNSLFKPWMHIINDALYAHCKQKYNLSIPSLLLVSEGIATDYCKKHKININYIESNANKKIELALSKDYYNKYIKKYNEMNFENINELIKNATEFSLILYGLFSAINNIIYSNTKKFESNNLSFEFNLNRHAIFHGITKDYGTLINSLKCFMLLDSLSILENKDFYLYF